VSSRRCAHIVSAHALGFAPRRRIGLLGGSFNPAHDGHRSIALEALRRLRLDEIWFLVSPGNPLKRGDGMAPFATRLASAEALRRGHPRLRAVALEASLGSRFTADTLRALRRRFPRHDWVWLMGADNLAQITSWRDWSSIFHAVPVAVLDRPAYSLKALAGKAARRFSTARRGPRIGPRLAGLAPPAWVFLHTRLHPASASAIRKRRRGKPG